VANSTGHEAQYVEITLDPGEQTIAEAGALMFMTFSSSADSRTHSLEAKGYSWPRSDNANFWS
jgi:uncharacterized protein (AIM24 family)